MFSRPRARQLARRLDERRRFIQVAAGTCELFYWRDRNREVDFVVRAGKAVTAIEVKSGRAPETLPGMQAFAAAFKPKRKPLVGGSGIAIEEFPFRPVEHWVGGW